MLKFCKCSICYAYCNFRSGGPNVATAIKIVLCAVVIWSDVLGGVFAGTGSLPWPGELQCGQTLGARREAGETTERSLLTENVLCILIFLSH